MNNKFLMMVATISGGVMMVALVVFAFVAGGEDKSSWTQNAINVPAGGFLLLFAWLAGGFSAMLFFNMNDKISVPDHMCRVMSLLAFKLAGFFYIALLIAGAYRGSYAIGFWLGLISSVVGAFSIYLTFNQKLAQKIADAAKSAGEDGEKSDDSEKAAE